jgi:hypothetical protein
VGPPGTGNDDHKAGIEIVRRALSLAGAPESPSRPARTAARRRQGLKKDQYAFGYDARSGEYVSVSRNGPPGQAARQS